MRKDALKAKLKKLVIMYDAKIAPASNYANGLKFKAGVLTINWASYTNTDEYCMAERIKALKEFVESKL